MRPRTVLSRVGWFLVVVPLLVLLVALVLTRFATSESARATALTGAMFVPSLAAAVVRERHRAFDRARRTEPHRRKPPAPPPMPNYVAIAT